MRPDHGSSTSVRKTHEKGGNEIELTHLFISIFSIFSLKFF